MSGLEDLSGRLHDYKDNHHEIETALQKQKNKLDKHLEQGSAARDGKHLEKIKVIFTKMGNLTDYATYKKL